MRPLRQFSVGLSLSILMAGFAWLGACGPDATAGPVMIEGDTTIVIVDDSASRAKLDSLRAILDSLVTFRPRVDTVFIVLPPDTVTIWLPQDTVYLPSDTVYRCPAQWFCFPKFPYWPPHRKPKKP